MSNRNDDPPSGWYQFGTHAGWDAGTVPPMEFSHASDEAGMPLWERPVPPPAATPSPESAGAITCECSPEWLRTHKVVHESTCPDFALPTPAPGVSGETREAVALVREARALHQMRHGDFKTGYGDKCSLCSVQKWEPGYNESVSWREGEPWPCAMSVRLDAVLAALAPGPAQEVAMALWCTFCGGAHMIDDCEDYAAEDGPDVPPIDAALGPDPRSEPTTPAGEPLSHPAEWLE